MNWLLASMPFGSFVVYGWAIRAVFSRERGVNLRMQALQTFGLLSAAVHITSVWSSSPSAKMAILSAVVYGTGMAIFVAAVGAARAQRLTLAFSSDLPAGLVHTGVFAYIRHPFYWSYSLTWIAGLIAAPTIWTALTAGVMCGFYAAAARQEERKFAASALCNDYERYRRRTWGLYGP